VAGHGSSNRAVVAALLANAGIAIAKFVAFLFTRSSAMLAESIHSVADAGNQGLLLLGVARAKRAPTARHPFGYGRERYFWAFVVALVLFTLGSLFSLYEGVHKLTHLEPIARPEIAIGVLLVAIVLEFFSLRTAVEESNKARMGSSWTAFIRHSRQPELPVVLLEDIGALVGLFLALFGVGLAVLTGDPAWDGYGTLAIGVLLGVIAIILVIEMKSLLIGEGATDSDLLAIRSTCTDAPGVVSLLHLQTEHLGPEELLVAGKLELDAHLTFAEVAATIDEVERRIRQAVPMARVIYLEPDVVSQPAPVREH
jgi:cation diffusion facilitator family transporter